MYALAFTFGTYALNDQPSLQGGESWPRTKRRHTLTTHARSFPCKEGIMSHRFSRRPLLAAPLALSMVGLRLPPTHRAYAQEATPMIGAAAPEEVAAHLNEWPMPKRDYANTRATMDAVISS